MLTIHVNMVCFWYSVDIVNDLYMLYIDILDFGLDLKCYLQILDEIIV